MSVRVSARLGIGATVDPNKVSQDQLIQGVWALELQSVINFFLCRETWVVNMSLDLFNLNCALIPLMRLDTMSSFGFGTN